MLEAQLCQKVGEEEVEGIPEEKSMIADAYCAQPLAVAAVVMGTYHSTTKLIPSGLHRFEKVLL